MIYLLKYFTSKYDPNNVLNVTLYTDAFIVNGKFVLTLRASLHTYKTTISDIWVCTYINIPLSYEGIKLV